MAFLDGEEEEETNDFTSYWRSIPDPPTPTTAVAAAPDDPAADGGAPPEEEDAPTQTEVPGRRPRKRPSAFRDVTNRRDVHREKRTAAVAASDAAGETAAVASSGGNGEGDGPEVEVEDATREDERRRKRRKRRRSLVIPSELSPPCDDGEADGATDGGATAAPPSISIESHRVDKSTLLRLVRSYCALPPDRRAASSEAARLESLTSYPLPGKRRPVMGEVPSRQEFLLRVQPIVVEMEGQKRRDAADARAATNCEVERNGRAGYRYYEVEGGARVGAEEYKRRYGAMVEERRRERTRGRCGGEESSRNDVEDEPPSQRESAVGPDESLVDSLEARPSAKSDDSNMEMDESVNMDDSVACEEAEEERASVEKAPPLDAQTDELDETPANDSQRKQVPATADGQVEAEASNDGPDQLEGNSHPPPVGMPPSNDPRILAARETLRRAMDAALADYSREVLAVEAADRRGRCAEGGP